eukprot:sb/3477013/
MLLIRLLDALVCIGLYPWIKYPYVKIGTVHARPEAPGPDVKSGTICCDCPSWKGRPPNVEKVRFGLGIKADSAKLFRDKVSHVVVPVINKSSKLAGNRMIDAVIFSTGTLIW